jgi:deoxyribose-phosphate aldolase
LPAVTRTADVAKTLEATLLRPTARTEELDALCEQAARDHCAAVVVFPAHVSHVHARLTGSDVRVVAAIAFPYGADATRTKIAGVEQAIRDGADEVEVVASLPALALRDFGAVRDELAIVTRAARLAAGARGVLVKATVETCYLDEGALGQAARAVEAAGCDFVVTSTGVGPEGATERGVAVLRHTLGRGVAIKAAGGILSLADAESMLAAGAARLGTTAAAAIVEEAAEPARRR